MPPSEQIAALLTPDKDGNYGCPFCLSPASTHPYDNRIISCPKKGCALSGYGYSYTLWNQRAYLPVMRQMVRDIQGLRSSCLVLYPLVQGLAENDILLQCIKEILETTKHYENL